MAAPTLDDVKTQLNITGATNNVELTLYLNAAIRVVENEVGPMTVQSFTETVNSRSSAILLSKRPIQSITSITPLLNSWPALASTDVSFDPNSGTVWRKDLGPLAGSWSVTYTAGLTTVGDNIRLATLIIVQHLWQTQRGPDSGPYSGGEDTVVAPGMGYAIPNRAMELLRSDQMNFGIA